MNPLVKAAIARALGGAHAPARRPSCTPAAPRRSSGGEGKRRPRPTPRQEYPIDSARGSGAVNVESHPPRHPCPPSEEGAAASTLPDPVQTFAPEEPPPRPRPVLAVVTAEPSSRGKGRCGGCLRFDQLLYGDELRCADCKANPPPPRKFTKVELPARTSAARLTPDVIGETVETTAAFEREDDARRRWLDEQIAAERQAMNDGRGQRTYEIECTGCGDPFVGHNARRKLCVRCSSLGPGGQRTRTVSAHHKGGGGSDG